jgi:hypothetical protein
VKTFQIATLVGVFASQPLLASAAITTPTVRDEQQMTQLGSQLLQDANHADQALQKNDDGAANKDIDDAITLRTKLAQDAKADGSSMTVPLYTDLDDTEYLSTVGKKTTSEAATSATTASAKSGAQPLTVQSNVGQVTYLAIDLDKTNSRLNAAKIAIRNKNDQAAEDSLSAIGSNLVAVSVSTDLPLLTAREDLALARTALNAKNNQAATADLHQASQALTAYAASGPRAADARKLSGEIDAAAGAAATPSAVSTQTVDSWWQRVKDWFAHPSV